MVLEGHSTARWTTTEVQDVFEDHRAKKAVKESTGGLAFEALKILLRKWASEALANVHLPI